MIDDEPTGELRRIQLDKELAERDRSELSTEEQDARQHDRRADKAAYLREKLEERARSEEDRDD